MRLAALIALAALTGPALSESALPLPFNLGGSFELVDHTGTVRGEADPNGTPQLLFFGYANCQEICSAALPLMAEIADELERDGTDISPVMITVDPVRDTVETLGPALTLHRDDFIGLTGSDEALQVAYDAYSVEKEEIFVDPEYGPVYAHGSFIYLLDGDGDFLTLFPPVLDPEKASEIVAKYLAEIG